MTLTADQHQQLIVLQVGDDAAMTLASSIALLWAAHADVADLPLRALYTKRDAIGVMLGRVRGQVTFRAPDGSAVNLSDLTSQLRAMLAETEALITTAQSGADGAAAIGDLTTTAPIMPTGTQINPNDRAYRGDPLRTRRRIVS